MNVYWNSVSNKWHAIADMLLTPVFWCGAAVAIATTAVVAPWLARRRAVSRRRAWLLLASLWLIVLLTAPVISLSALVHLPQAWSTHRALTWVAKGWGDVSLWNLGIQGWANVLLYIPAGGLLASVSRRPWLSFLGLFTLSVLTETLQAGLLVRTADPGDVYANSLGALIGVSAWIVIRAVRNGALATRRWWSRALVVPLVVVAAGGILSQTLTAHAARDQEQLLHRVQHAYSGTTLADARSASRRNYNEFAKRSGSWPDYLGMTGRRNAEARFSTSDHARPRCVFVHWQGNRAATFTLGSGAPCQSFKDPQM